MKLLKRSLKKIKKNLMKKVTIVDYFFEDDHLVYELILTNFWSLKKKIEITIKIGDDEHVLTHQLDKKRLFINVPLKLFSLDFTNAKILTKINGKKMWITEARQLKLKADSLLLNNKYFLTVVRKDIHIVNKFPDMSFSNQKFICKHLSSAYNEFSFSMNDSQIFPKGLTPTRIEIIAMSRNKMRILEGDYFDKKIKVKNIEELSTGLWQLFFNHQNTLYPLSISEETDDNFDSYHHSIQYTFIRNDIYLKLRPHILKVNTLEISREDDLISLMIDSSVNIVHEKNFTFLINDVRSNEESSWPLELKNEKLYCRIPLSTLAENFSKKRFFVREEGSTPRKYQFHIRKSDLTGDYIRFQEIIESQMVRFSFYKRKDRSLGLSIARPSIQKSIDSVDGNIIKGYLGSLDKFIDVDPYLTLEDRNSQDSMKLKLDSSQNVFSIDLTTLDFITFKSKDKTIFDLYIELIDKKSKDIIRKEKIKYQSAEYKKDNFYSQFILEDSNQNKHYFLLTTTPFKNVKVETFTIPSHIEIPTDTSKKDQNIWLIGERYDTAQDNGIVLFEWLQKNTDIEAYYVVEADSPDYLKIKDNPNVLAFGSPKHYEIAFKAKVLLGTHDLENILPYKPAKGFFHYEDTYRIFLQHGVLGRKNVEYHKKYYDLPFHLFIVSSDAEKYDVVMEEMGYEENEVVVTGLARFDKLVQENEPKDILLMPTWRDWINTDQRFLESKYFSMYSSLINDERLQALLEKYDVNLNFYPHYRAQDYFQSNMDSTVTRVNFIPFGSKRVQDLLIEHALLITDYSSVSFDFLKMNKPIIYYHFDVRRFFKNGILRPIEETFIGRTANTKDELIDLIEDRLIHDFENYNVNISGVIKYNDRSNCKRIYEEVCKIIKKNR